MYTVTFTKCLFLSYLKHTAFIVIAATLLALNFKEFAASEHWFNICVRHGANRCNKYSETSLRGTEIKV